MNYINGKRIPKDILHLLGYIIWKSSAHSLHNWFMISRQHLSECVICTNKIDKCASCPKLEIQRLPNCPYECHVYSLNFIAQIEKFVSWIIYSYDVHSLLCSGQCALFVGEYFWSRQQLKALNGRSIAKTGWLYLAFDFMLKLCSR